ncbi:MAG: FAD binding domain-containing protein [bacterium]
MNNVKEFCRPETVEEAVELLTAGDLKSSVVAGSTDISRSESKAVERLVDIKGLDLNYIKSESGALVIGATTTMAEVAGSDIVSDYAGGLVSRVASEIGTTPLRNMITVGGNITQLRVWSDMPVALLALEAEVKTEGPAGAGSYSADEFFAKHPGQVLDDGELVTEVVFPASRSDYKSEFIKFNKTNDSFATATVAVSLDRSGDTCEDVRIALGAVGPRPVYCKQASQKVSGSEAGADVFAEAGKIARENTATTDNVWGSAEYKSTLIERLVPRALNSCID